MATSTKVIDDGEKKLDKEPTVDESAERVPNVLLSSINQSKFARNSSETM